MSDTYRRYRAIRHAFLQLYHPRPTGHQAQHLDTLVRLICGIIGSRQSQLPKLVEHIPGTKAKDKSLIQQFSRWLTNRQVTQEQWVVPVATALLQALAHRPLQLIFDGSVVGRGCQALLVSVVYHGRALPLAWVVIKAPKGHFPQATHCDLLAVIQTMMPPHAQVTVLGDGEFDGTRFQAQIQQAGWFYACRTASNLRFTAPCGHGQMAALAVAPDLTVFIEQAHITGMQYGPVNVLMVWEPKYKAPIYLVTNLATSSAALEAYRLRAHIETFFSDQKSRGFHLDRSHLSDPVRLARLMCASCLAYLWIIYLGTWGRSAAWRTRIHRGDRCDLSLFQLGLRLLSYCLRHTCAIPKGCLPPALLPTEPGEKAHTCSVG